MKPYIQETLSDDKGSVVSAQRIPPKSEGGGGDVTTTAVLNALNGMSRLQKSGLRALLDVPSWGDIPRTIDVYPEGSDVEISPQVQRLYKCGTLTSLTISNPTASGAYSIVFTSGATPTVTTIPATILGLEDFAAEANTLYEINVLDNRAVVGSWAVTA